jgi:hypothetical protein
MKTLEETFVLIDRLFYTAYDECRHLWEEADSLMHSENIDMDYWQDLRDQAAEEQYELFRNLISIEDDGTIAAIRYWIQEDENFRQRILDYAGIDEDQLDTIG